MTGKPYDSMFSLKGRHAVVTGGCGLIGAEIVAALRASGATVYCADSSAERFPAVAGDDPGIRFLPLDISSEVSVHEMLAVPDRLDILVNSAYPRTADWGTRIEEVPFDSWKTNLDSHLGGYFLASRAAAERMKAQGGGSIVNIASIYGMVGPDFSVYEGTSMTMPVAYAAIKGGVISLSRYLATFYGAWNVRANVISPGGIFDNQNPTFVKRYSSKTPLGRMGSAEDIAGAVVFLASDAASYVTGHNLVVDGGWTAW